MKQISSRDNPVFKRLSRLAAGKPERLEGEPGYLLLIEGHHLCLAWLDHAGQPEAAFFDEERLAGDAQVRALAGRVPEVRSTGLAPSLARALSQVGHGQGVYFLVRAPAPERPALIRRSALWLDQIQDPGNVGTLLRTAAAAGISQVYLSSGCAAAWSPKVLRSAQGAHFVLAVYEHVDLAAETERLRIPLVATSLQRAVSLYDAELADQCVWVMGNEGQGVSPALLERADQRVFIPQESAVESLNVAAAAAVCLFEHRRRQLAGDSGG